MTTILPIKLPIPTSPNLILVFLTFSSQAETQRRINVEGLLNAGCLAGDFAARRIVEKYDIQPIAQSVMNRDITLTSRSPETE